MAEREVFSIKKIRILLLAAFSPPVGGMAAWTENTLASKLADNVYFIPIDITPRGIYLRHRIIRIFLSFITFAKILNKLFKYSPQISHIHTNSYTGFYEKALWSWLLKRMGVATILHIHGGGFNHFYEHANSIQKRLIQYFLTDPDVIIALSEMWKNFFLSIASKAKVHVLPNGINGEVFNNFPGVSIKTELGIPSSAPLILFINRIGPQKGVLDLLESLPFIFTQFPDAHLLLAGPGATNELISQIKKKNFGARVHLPGSIIGSVKIAAFREAAVFVLPSYIEGLPISLIEALAAGLPVVATKVGAIPEIIKEGLNGFLISPGDQEELARKICAILSNKKLAASIRNNNKKIFMESFQINKVNSQLINIYQQLTETKS